jgi:hypothetical protein
MNKLKLLWGEFYHKKEIEISKNLYWMIYAFLCGMIWGDVRFSTGLFCIWVTFGSGCFFIRLINNYYEEDASM